MSTALADVHVAGAKSEDAVAVDVHGAGAAGKAE